MQSETATPQPLSDLTAIRRDILAIVSKHTGAAGVEIKTSLEEAYDRDEISVAKIYPALDALVDLGFVEKTDSDGRTNSYSITKSGALALRAHADWYQGTLNEF